MPTNPMNWTGLLQNSVSPSILTDDTSDRLREWNYHAFVSGTFGAGPPTVQIQYSPDYQGVPDGLSRWFAPAGLSCTSQSDILFQAKPRKFRVVITGGDGTTSVNVSIR